MMNDEDMIMLEIVNSVTRGDEVDFVLGGDTEIHPSDFDDHSDEGVIMGMVDFLLDGSNSTSKD